jgi:hypothetical protein
MDERKNARKRGGWEVTFEDIVEFSVTCLYILMLTMEQVFKFPIMAGKRCFWAALPFAALFGVGYAMFKLGDVIYYWWFGLQY